MSSGVGSSPPVRQYESSAHATTSLSSSLLPKPPHSHPANVNATTNRCRDRAVTGRG